MTMNLREAGLRHNIRHYLIGKFVNLLLGNTKNLRCICCFLSNAVLEGASWVYTFDNAELPLFADFRNVSSARKI